MRGDGSSNEERLRTGRRYRTDRTEGISDGVFAVSLTLLILDVRPPEGGVSQLVHGLVVPILAICAVPHDLGPGLANDQATRAAREARGPRDDRHSGCCVRRACHRHA